MNTSAREERRPPPRHNCRLAPHTGPPSLVPEAYRRSRAATPLLPAPPPSPPRASRPASRRRRAGATLVARAAVLLVAAALVVRPAEGAGPGGAVGAGPPTSPFTQAQLYEASWDWMNEANIADAASKWGDVADWDTSGCTSFENLWSAHRNKLGARADWGNYNAQGVMASGTGQVLAPADLNKWDSSRVTSMKSTFQVALKFNSDLYVCERNSSNARSGPPHSPRGLWPMSS